MPACLYGKSHSISPRSKHSKALYLVLNSFYDLFFQKTLKLLISPEFPLPIAFCKAILKHIFNFRKKLKLLTDFSWERLQPCVFIFLFTLQVGFFMKCEYVFGLIGISCFGCAYSVILSLVYKLNLISLCDIFQMGFGIVYSVFKFSYVVFVLPD